MRKAFKYERHLVMDATLIEMAAFMNDENRAYELIERLRWPDGPRCPREDCGSDIVYRLKVKSTKRRVLKCGECRRQFTVTVGTIFEDSHIPLGKWVAAFYLMCSSKKGISTHQLHRHLGISYKSALFMTHRIRYAMTQPPLADKLRGVVEVDETYVGGRIHRGKGRAKDNKLPVITMIERKGRARSVVSRSVKGKAIKRIVRDNVEDMAHIMTDSFLSYRGLDEEFAGHDWVDHSKEYVRGIVHTNFAESFFSLLKRGILGTFHHVSEQHMPRYLAEFDFRWNNRRRTDAERMVAAIKGAEGKRLMLRSPSA